jgi:hypothetical protein
MSELDRPIPGVLGPSRYKPLSNLTVMAYSLFLSGMGHGRDDVYDTDSATITEMSDTLTMAVFLLVPTNRHDRMNRTWDWKRLLASSKRSQT